MNKIKLLKYWLVYVNNLKKNISEKRPFWKKSILHPIQLIIRINRLTAIIIQIIIFLSLWQYYHVIHIETLYLRYYTSAPLFHHCEVQLRVVFERRQQQSFSDIKCIYPIEREDIERNTRANGEIVIVEWICLSLATYGVSQKSHYFNIAYIFNCSLTKICLNTILCNIYTLNFK